MGATAVFTSIANALTGGVVDKALGMIDKLIPDKNLATQLKANLETLRQTEEHELEMAENALAGAQIAVNQAEASNPSVFVSGWRPAIGWISAAGLAWNYVFAPMVQWGAFLTDHKLDGMPILDLSGLMGLVTAMLGIAGLRSIDKYNGVARDTLKK